MIFGQRLFKGEVEIKKDTDRKKDKWNNTDMLRKFLEDLRRNIYGGKREIERCKDTERE